jgi:hypothetical protein
MYHRRKPGTIYIVHPTCRIVARMWNRHDIVPDPGNSILLGNVRRRKALKRKTMLIQGNFARSSFGRRTIINDEMQT